MSTSRQQALAAVAEVGLCCKDLKFPEYKSCCEASLAKLTARIEAASSMAMKGDSTAAIQEYKNILASASGQVNDCARLKSAEAGYALMKTRIDDLAAILAARRKKPGTAAKLACLDSRLASIKLAADKLAPVPTICGDKGDPHGYLLSSEAFWNQAKQPCP